MSKRAELLRMIAEECLCTDSEYELSTGVASSFYFDCKRVTLKGRGLALVSELILERIDDLPERPDAVAGLTLGADPIIAGVILSCPSLNGSIVRKERKARGTRNKIENQLPPNTKVVVVDDVVTSGTSTDTACQELVKEGYDVVGIIAIVDREDGGLERLKTKYGNAVSLFAKSDFPRITEQEGRDCGGSANPATATA